MDEVIESLETPLFLIAMPPVNDPYFHRSVVLLLERTDDGAVGLIINRPTELSVAVVLEGLEIPWHGHLAAATWFGGPVQPNLGTVLCAGLAEEIDPETVVELAAGVHFSQDAGFLKRIASAPPPRFRLLLGYAGWESGQLEEELGRNDWLIAPFDPELLFFDSDQIWGKALQSIGVRPESLAFWTHGDPEEGSN